MKLYVLAALLSITISSPAFATPNDIPTFKGMQHFVQKFPQATEVECKVKGQLTDVSFTWNGLHLHTFYDGEGNPVATCRPVEIDNLPLFVQLNVKKQYASYVMREAVEYTDSDDSLSYFVAVAGPKNSYLLHVSTSGSISVFKKM